MAGRLNQTVVGDMGRESQGGASKEERKSRQRDQDKLTVSSRGELLGKGSPVPGWRVQGRGLGMAGKRTL